MVQIGPSSICLNARYRACREYTKGTQARSPTESMKPKPSVVISIVVRIAGWNIVNTVTGGKKEVPTSLYTASTTYQPWKAKTSHMESVMLLKPPRRVACSQAMLISIRTHKIRPGLSSLKDLTSNEPMAGLSSRPMKNYKISECAFRKIMRLTS